MHEDYFHVIEVLNRYASACDKREWELLDQVFTEDVEASYGGYPVNGRNIIRKMLQNSLGGCGPTQHLLGNIDVRIDGNDAQTSCYVRAFHTGINANEGKTYEVFGEYQDQLKKDNGCWLIINRTMIITDELGTRDVLAPG